ncbi:DUF4097 family beta strand repeat-containing protein [Hymenobacter chitinivorans]|uniref:DUF4097 domain-containing protein n=1 Tax=Hymenobacter chitinivorans DSM 11115 TaxID=1121954 RepID=A0A2M9BQG8_9BACT|nr:DUF4097 family beta strand repeat-containing protein [Hymenobacter chitinivorans]PJJ60210.1 hypothetical protein CLV45_1635 [Hymenobacter chitinivorans DSM 11115]
MKTSFFRLRAGVLLLLLTLSLTVAAQNKEQLVVPLSSPGKPGLLSAKLVNGSITVVGYAGKDVVIDASSRSSRDKDDDNDDNDDGRPAPPKGMKRIASNSGFDLTAEEQDNKVSVKSNSYQRPVNLTIKVPQHFSLQLKTVNDGDIVVENVTGELEISNVNGGVILRQVSGSAVANTVNGPIKAYFKTVTAGAPMAFSTVNGQVDVTLPATAKASLKLKSDQGEVYSDFDLVPEKTAPKVNRTNQNGVYRVSTDSWTYGRLNGGGAEIMMKSLMGNIYIRKAK